MQKVIAFDFDGVLVDCKHIHFLALNLALAKVGDRYTISQADHEAIYDGLPTKIKLIRLTEATGLPESLYQGIWEDKQQNSKEMFKNISKDLALINIFKTIKDLGIKIAVTSNSIRDTLIMVLTSLGVINLVDYILSNEDVESPKPSPEIYLKCMDYFGTDKDHMVIFEDSPVGKAAALASGAKLIEIANRADLDLIKIKEATDYLNRNK